LSPFKLSLSDVSDGLAADGVEDGFWVEVVVILPWEKHFLASEEKLM